MSDSAELILYSTVLDAEDLKQVLEKAIQSLSGGYATVELYGENLFVTITGESSSSLLDYVPNMISGRLFNGEKQIKFRKIQDNEFRLVTDFKFDGLDESNFEAKVEEHDYFLWGYKSDKPELKEYLFEERIPHLFSYPMGESIEKSFGKSDRVMLRVKVYYDNDTGRPIWDRFIKLERWQPPKEDSPSVKPEDMTKEEREE